MSYTWVKQALPGAGLVKRKAKRGVHRKRREPRPLPGMLLHIDGSHHQWFQDERWHDLIVILDDATPVLVPKAKNITPTNVDPSRVYHPRRAIIPTGSNRQ